MADELRAAFMAGFAASGEGWNGKHPWAGDPEGIDNALDGAFLEWLARASDRSLVGAPPEDSEKP